MKGWIKLVRFPGILSSIPGMAGCVTVILYSFPTGHTRSWLLLGMRVHMCCSGNSPLRKTIMAAQLLKPARSNSASNAIQSLPGKAGPRLLTLRPCASGAMVESQLPTPFGTELVIRRLLEACVSPAASIKLTTSLGGTTASSQGGGWTNSVTQPTDALWSVQ